MVYGVTIQTLNRLAGNGITMLFVEANDPVSAELRARRIAQARFECDVIVDHPLPCPGFAPTPDTEEPDRRS